MTSGRTIEAGGSAAAIRHHYDVGNDFFSAWLDPMMVYSSALWDGPDDASSLEDAQRRKLRYHADSVGAAPGMRVLDVGCGWGAQMTTLLDDYGVASCVGLTLSDEQAAHVRAIARPEIAVETVNWHDYQPEAPFDAVISVGAFEHFAHPEQSREERRAIYRRFFDSCLRWTEGRGRLSLQTIAYGTMTPGEANPFISGDIFPAAELPTLEDIVVASQGLFRILRLRDDGMDYARTCQAWARRLRAELTREGRTLDRDLGERYHRYLRLSAAGFAMGKIGLLRLRFDPVAPARGA